MVRIEVACSKHPLLSYFLRRLHRLYCRHLPSWYGRGSASCSLSLLDRILLWDCWRAGSCSRCSRCSRRRIRHTATTPHLSKPYKIYYLQASRSSSPEMAVLTIFSDGWWRTVTMLLETKLSFRRATPYFWFCINTRGFPGGIFFEFKLFRRIYTSALWTDDTEIFRRDLPYSECIMRNLWNLFLYVGVGTTASVRLIFISRSRDYSVYPYERKKFTPRPTRISESPTKLCPWVPRQLTGSTHGHQTPSLSLGKNWTQGNSRRCWFTCTRSTVVTREEEVSRELRLRGGATEKGWKRRKKKGD